MLFTVALVFLLAVVTAVGLAMTLLRAIKNSSIHELPEFVVAHTMTSPDLVGRSTNFDPRRTIDELAAAGFEPAGAFRFDLPDHSAVFSVLLASDGNTFAVVTPAHVALCSDFNGKLAETSSTTAGAHMPYELNNGVPRASVGDLIRRHGDALDRIATVTSRNPNHLGQTTVMRVALGIEQFSLENFSARRAVSGPIASFAARVRRGDGPTDRAIQRWMENPAHWGHVPG